MVVLAETQQAEQALQGTPLGLETAAVEALHRREAQAALELQEQTALLVRWA